MDVSWSATGGWDRVGASNEPAEGMRFGDFNGDGCTDIFRKNGLQWEVSFGSPARTMSSWTSIGSSGEPLDGLRFGDFDGNGVTDLFRISGSEWQMSFGDRGPDGHYVEHTVWNTVGSSGVGFDEMRFGDFDADGSTDILRVLPDRFDVSLGSSARVMGSWRTQNALPPLADPGALLIGDFDGDGKDDVVRLSTSFVRTDPVK